jgi:hypothetical protein
MFKADWEFISALVGILMIAAVILGIGAAIEDYRLRRR